MLIILRELRKTNEKLAQLQEQVEHLLDARDSNIATEHGRVPHVRASQLSPCEADINGSATTTEPDFAGAVPQVASGQSRLGACHGPTFLGPTSFQYHMKLVREPLQHLGVQLKATPDSSLQLNTRDNASNAADQLQRTRSKGQALLEISETKCLRLIEFFAEDSESVMELTDVEVIKETARRFYAAGGSQGASHAKVYAKTNLVHDSGPGYPLLRTVVAIALVMDERGPSELAVRLVQELLDALPRRIFEPPNLIDIHELMLLVCLLMVMRNACLY